MVRHNGMTINSIIVITIIMAIKQKKKLNGGGKVHTDILTNNVCDSYICNYT